MPMCFKCGEEITFNKNILSKTGKQIPLYPDQQSTHGHDDDGNPVRGALPSTAARTSTYQQGPVIENKPQYRNPTTVNELRGTPNNTPPQQTATSNPSLEAVLLTQINTAISTLTKAVENLQKTMNLTYEKIEYNTQVDTSKLIGQLQIVNDTIAPFLNTQLQVGSDLWKDQQERQRKAQEEKYKKEQEEQANWNNKPKGEVEEKELEDAGI